MNITAASTAAPHTAISRPRAFGRSLARRLIVVAAMALSASLMTAALPTSASALDIGGLIGVAMALQSGGHGHYSSHRGRSHVASRHERRSSGSRSHDEDNDAKEVDASAQSGTKVAGRQTTVQASAPDRMAADAPSFNPSR